MNETIVKKFCNSSSRKLSYGVLMDAILLCFLNCQYNENTVQHKYFIIKNSTVCCYKSATCFDLVSSSSGS